MKAKKESLQDSLQTPVLFLVFNRPSTTAQVFESIRRAQPPRLYVAADGPRLGVDCEIQQTAKVRRIATNIDWHCELKTLFRDKNMGCKFAISDAINWFFKHEEEGIILEDDCLPSQSFFWFCEELLNRYRIDNRIFMISGYNYKGKFGDNDYFYSNIGGIWGWATWRRAWEKYTVDFKQLEIMHGKDFYKLKFLLGSRIYQSRKSHWYSLDRGLDSWGYQWSFVRHFNNGLSCVSGVNLIKNIGIGDGATHTKKSLFFSFMPSSYEINLPTKPNNTMLPDRNYDKGIHPRKNFFFKLLRFSLSVLQGCRNFFFPEKN